MLIDYFSLLYRLLIHLGWWKDDGKRFVLIQDLPAVTIGFNLGADLYHQMDLESWGKHQPLEESFHDGTDCTSLDVQRKERYSPARKCKIQEIRWKLQPGNGHEASNDEPLIKWRTKVLERERFGEEWKNNLDMQFLAQKMKNTRLREPSTG